jgi:hypothetical protein
MGGNDIQWGLPGGRAGRRYFRNDNGVVDIAVFRPSRRDVVHPQSEPACREWGLPGRRDPGPGGRYDGDSGTDVAIYRPT